MEVPVFNQARAKFYPFNEVYLEAPKKETKVAGDSPTKHLDSYVPNTEIVSRKYAQLNEDQRRLQLLDKKNDNETLERLTLLIQDSKSVIYTSVQTTK